MRYKDAGVDIDKEGKFIQALISKINYKRRDFPPASFGHFTGLIDMGSFYIAMNTDGVGTKIIIANQLKKWDTIGIDCIAMNVNDTICVGAEPIGFVDYLAISSYDEEIAEQIGKGLNEGAKQANINILGGETATIPDIVNGIDLSGTSIGVVKKEKLITGKDIRKGDLIIGIPSSGIHSNGLTLARKVLDIYEKFEDWTVGEELLRPTRIYVRDILNVLRKCRVHGLAHITGGGITNLLRLKRMKYVIDSPLPPHKIFKVIMEFANVEYEEMYKTYNMGMGFAIIAPEDCEIEIKREIRDARTVGYVDEGYTVEIPELKLRYTSYL
ncbi:phosphoribosylformylglycinamidine cyclo-ligase [Euryarchaeota archaeon ex4484_178]|nr:MAG: phosphoribosylformylglycinamidine cyclo-ligase [Euryarchaeota archaeon ex4484_178]